MYCLLSFMFTKQNNERKPMYFLFSSNFLSFVFGFIVTKFILLFFFFLLLLLLSLYALLSFLPSHHPSFFLFVIKHEKQNSMLFNLDRNSEMMCVKLIFFSMSFLFSSFFFSLFKMLHAHLFTDIYFRPGWIFWIIS